MVQPAGKVNDLTGSRALADYGDKPKQESLPCVDTRETLPEPC